jgi:lipopolysaccharide assembly outer membrane protein LptD (OstA)
MVRAVLVSCVVCLLAVSAAAAQQPPAAPTQPAAVQPAPAPPAVTNPLANLTGQSGSWEQVEAGHFRYTAAVALELAGGVKLFADVVEIFTTTNKIVATGNVVFTNPDGRLSAERVEFDVTTATGTFHQASGIMTLGPTVDRAQFGNQDPDIYFFGDLIEKLGPQRYRITRGGFSTCVQPTPRWEVTSSSVILNLNDYAISRNTLLRVKGVPLFYLPVLYYPINDKNRSTGFLMPTYGTSTFRGQTVSNGFFWAIDRSQDLTLMHDWFTRTGQGVGAEYRYVTDAQSSGTFRTYLFDQKQSDLTQPKDIFQLTGSARQRINRELTAQANINYFSDVLLQQLYHQDIYQATQRQRTIGLGLSGNFPLVSAGLYYQQSEVFSSETQSVLYGSTPRATVSFAPKQLFGSPAYVSLNADYSYLPQRSINNGVITQDTSLGRLDAQPSIRLPLSHLTFLSVNTTAGYRTTYYTRSKDATGALVDDGLLRRYLQTRTDIIGPVFTKIWDTPGNTTIQRMKHVVEPSFAVEYITGFANQGSVPSVSDPTDFVVGSSTRLTYGLTNRLLYRQRTINGVVGTTREFLSVGVQQTYYSNPTSSRADTTYLSASGRSDNVDLSPVALTMRVSPSAAVDANARVEYDVSGNGLQVVTTGTSFNMARGTGSVTFSRQRLVPTSPPNTFLSTSATTNFLQNRFKGTYALSWDVARNYIVSQSVMTTYMAQCCGVQLEFQRYNLPVSSSYSITSDQRFNFSFVLAGLGTFSNFFGAFGGGTVR